MVNPADPRQMLLKMMINDRTQFTEESLREQGIDIDILNYCYQETVRPFLDEIVLTMGVSSLKDQPWFSQTVKSWTAGPIPHLMQEIDRADLDVIPIVSDFMVDDNHPRRGVQSTLGKYLMVQLWLIPRHYQTGQDAWLLCVRNVVNPNREPLVISSGDTLEIHDNIRAVCGVLERSGVLDCRLWRGEKSKGETPRYLPLIIYRELNTLLRSASDLMSIRAGKIKAGQVQSESVFDRVQIKQSWER